MTLQPAHQADLLVDAHVHLHSCFDIADCLNAALANFQYQSGQLNLNQPVVGALLLAEVSGVNAFAHLAEVQQSSQALSDWEIALTAEPAVICFTQASGHRLLIAAGRQVVTQENIEVLALITDAAIEDGLSLEHTLAAAIATDSLPVLPWGVGKWLGRRGELVRAQLQDSHSSVFVGDNGGRPNFWPLPNYCKRRVQLAGSDPLPLPHEVNRAGSFGFLTRGWVDWDKPGSSLKQILRKPQPFLQPYGQLQSPWKFVQNQSLIRLS